MNVVAKVIAVGKHTAAWAYRERKCETSLIRIAPRLHANFHHAFAYGAFITKLRKVPDRIKIHDCGPRPSGENAPMLISMQPCSVNPPGPFARSSECSVCKSGRESHGTA